MLQLAQELGKRLETRAAPSATGREVTHYQSLSKYWVTNARVMASPRPESRRMFSIDIAEKSVGYGITSLTIHPVGGLEPYAVVDLAESGVNESVYAPRPSVVVQASLGCILDFSHDRRHDLRHPLRPTEWHGLARKLPGSCVTCDDDVGVVRDPAESGVSARFQHTDPEVLEDAAIGHDDTLRRRLVS